MDCCGVYSFSKGLLIYFLCIRVFCLQVCLSTISLSGVCWLSYGWLLAAVWMLGIQPGPLEE